MHRPIERYDALIIGGGIFGIYAALHLSRNQGRRILLIEKEAELLTKASIVNQARLHSGYHYPRSVATARMSDENRARFTQEHKSFIFKQFSKYYAIERFGSFTDAQQFERFCQYLNIRCDRVNDHPLFKYHRLEALYETEEFTFDPLLIAQYYRAQIIADPNCEVRCQIKLEHGETKGDQWEVHLNDQKRGSSFRIQTPLVINATYASSNAVLKRFELPFIDLMHEISEMVFVRIPGFEKTGLTVMDGPFASLMPYGKSELLSLSSVAYTHHQVSYNPFPTFDCQQMRVDCTPEFSANCLGCAFRPPSHAQKMIRQIRHYLSDHLNINYYSSLFTIKSKLRANTIDDGRPTEISKLHHQPNFYCIFAGKINSIYEIERVNLT